MNAPSEACRVLIAEDDPDASFILQETLRSSGYVVTSTENGLQALERLKRGRFAAALVDWMMPKMDGIQLIREIHASIKPRPVIVMVTAMGSERSRGLALRSGADEFIAKPYDPGDLLVLLENTLSRASQRPPSKAPAPKIPPPLRVPTFPVVCLAASTGGPAALRLFFRNLPVGNGAAFLVVNHGAAWMLEGLARSLDAETEHRVKLAATGDEVKANMTYLAPGDRHMVVDPATHRIRLADTPPDNFVRPAADQLFKSAAQAFGPKCVCVVMTGLGCDGAEGAKHVLAAGGRVLVQDPKNAIAPSMPEAVLEVGPVAGSHGLDILPSAVMRVMKPAGT